jgi:hypothetical protein
LTVSKQLVTHEKTSSYHPSQRFLLNAQPNISFISEGCIMKKALAMLSFLALVIIPAASPAEGDFYVVVAGKRAVRTVLVSPKSTATESGTALLSALAGITDASETKPYLLVIEPGIYDVGTKTVWMKEYVDIQGSGQNVTTIQGTVDAVDGVMTLANHAELCNLTVKHSGGGYWAIAITNMSAYPTITRVTASASGGTINYGLANSYSFLSMNQITASASGGTSSIGVSNYYSSPTMSQVKVSATGATDTNYAVINHTCGPTMTQVTASASGGATSYGVHNIDSSPTMAQVKASASEATQSYGVYNSANDSSYNTHIDHSLISGTTASVHTINGTCFIGNTRLDGGAVAGTGTNTCAGVYDENYVFYPSTCP